jgi:hypothetical protein
MAESNQQPIESKPEQPEGSSQPSTELPSPGQWFNSYFGGEWVAKAKEQVG